jgi:RNA polymerase sigma factor (sigma-70 family)
MASVSELSDHITGLVGGRPPAPMAGATGGASGAGDSGASGAYEDLTRLAAAAQAGDAVARASLLERLAPLVRGAAARAAWRARSLELGPVLDGDDLQQEARAIVLRLIEGYREASGPALPYFAIRLRSKLEQHLRREARRPAGRRLVWDSEATQALIDALGPPDVLPPDGGERGVALEGALARLTPRQRRILFLAYWLDFPDQAIGRRMGLGVAAVRQARYRALRALRSHLS